MFGMLCYELFARKNPFEGTDIANECFKTKKWAPFKRKVIEEGFRPELPEEWPDDLKSVINLCWHPSPGFRATIKQLNEHLRIFKNKVQAHNLPLPGFVQMGVSQGEEEFYHKNTPANNVNDEHNDEGSGAKSVYAKSVYGEGFSVYPHVDYDEESKK
eukprot:CAMPEP_0175137044 /NCGR_PEP_ID=MMETSP0087-20121206/9602_1 /TAXON_ID=136419 /ORGANISM="Unknown Unknown, Strain D1" /LENGTH=157 /DNA_ID=CAMNT_0016419847 /DNA_START=1 /DNA_END=474 /DNA_ORIENTATION=-